MLSRDESYHFAMLKLCFDTERGVKALIQTKRSAARNSILSFLAALPVLTLRKAKQGKTCQTVK